MTTGRHRPVPPPPLGRPLEQPAPEPPVIDSLIDDIVHARRLARSRRVVWLLGILWTLGTSVAGWAAGKLDTRSEVAKLSEHVAKLAGEVAVLTSQQADLVAEVRALSAAPKGPLYLQSEELRFVWRQLTQTGAAAYAGETPAVRERKRAAAREFGASFDRQIERRATPAAAADTVLSQIAVP